jgi:hypothetical protein
MRRFALGLTVVMLCLLAAPPVSGHDGVQTQFTVMTRNVYVGANLAKLVSASPLTIFDRVRQVFNRVKKTDFEERAESIADEIQTHKPLLIGLQEVALWRTQDPGDGPLTDADDVAFDFLQILMDELASRGLNYQVLKVFSGFDIEAPGDFGGDIRDVRFTDRDAIIGRVSHHFTYSNIKRVRFDSEFAIPTGFFGEFTYPRAWEQVDVKIVGSGKKVRFINTHLEVFSPLVNEDQAQEILDGPANTSLPVVVVGDLNAAPGAFLPDSHERFTDAGFTDAWAADNPNNSGRTCCQDANLLNEESKLTSRIDFVMVRGPLTVKSARRVGEEQEDRTPSGLWPSDHAGVVVKLRLEL